MNSVVFGIGVAGVVMIIQAVVTLVLDNWGVILLTAAFGAILFGIIPLVLRLSR